MAVFAFLEVGVVVFLGSEVGGKEGKEGQPDFDHGEEHCFLCLGQLPDFVVGCDDMKYVSERIWLV